MYYFPSDVSDRAITTINENNSTDNGTYGHKPIVLNGLYSWLAKTGERGERMKVDATKRSGGGGVVHHVPPLWKKEWQ